MWLISSSGLCLVDGASRIYTTLAEPSAHLDCFVNRFGRSVKALVAGVTKGKGLPPEVLDQIVNRTDGIPTLEIGMN
jgi:hypothetical protein